MNNPHTPAVLMKNGNSATLTVLADGKINVASFVADAESKGFTRNSVLLSKEAEAAEKTLAATKPEAKEWNDVAKAANAARAAAEAEAAEEAAALAL